MLPNIKKELAQQLLPLFQDTSWNTLTCIERALTSPKFFSHGHLALPVFTLAKELHQSPKDIAFEKAKQIQQQNVKGLTSVEAMSGFINFKFSSSYLGKFLCQFVFSQPAEASKPIKKIIIEYSSPNVAKPLGIGHLRATVIGQALYRLAKTQGFDVIGLNHLGDWGVQFGHLAWAYQEWKDEYNFKDQAMESLYQLYVRFHKVAETSPELKNKGSEYFRRLEAGDKDILRLWKMFVDITLKEHQKLYDLLGVKFDVVQGESFYHDKIDSTLQRIKDKGILKDSQGAKVVFVGDNDPPCLLQKSDGSSLYATRDIASALYRHEMMQAHDLLYVAGAEQSLHFKQVFGVLKQMQLAWAAGCHHIAFGLYRFKDQKMSTRKGNVIFMEDVLNETIQRTLTLIDQKNPTLKNKQKVAEQIGIGAVVFNDLMNDRLKNVDFEWSHVLNFEGDSGPYAQYCLVRCRSLLRKFTKDIHPSFKKELETPEAIQLLITLLAFPEILSNAWKVFKPHVLAQYILKLCQEFHLFYHKHRILGEPEDVEMTRMTLVYCVEHILSQSLYILGIPTPTEM